MTTGQITGFIVWLLFSGLTYVGVPWMVEVYLYFAWFISLFVFGVGVVGAIFILRVDIGAIQDYLEKQTVTLWIITLLQWVVTIYLLDLTGCFTQLALYTIGIICLSCTAGIAYIRQQTK